MRRLLALFTIIGLAWKKLTRDKPSGINEKEKSFVTLTSVWRDPSTRFFSFSAVSSSLR
jgi:hypothetical protein